MRIEAGEIGRISSEDADKYFGWFSLMASADNPTSSKLTQELLGWRPVQPVLIPDIDRGHYFTD